MPLKNKYLHIYEFFGLVGQEYFSNDALMKFIMETFWGGGWVLFKRKSFNIIHTCQES
jgi:hypothetical protein